MRAGATSMPGAAGSALGLLVLLAQAVLLRLLQAPVLGEVAFFGPEPIHRRHQPGRCLVGVGTEAHALEQAAAVGERLDHREGTEEPEVAGSQADPGADDEDEVDERDATDGGLGELAETTV